MSIGETIARFLVREHARVEQLLGCSTSEASALRSSVTEGPGRHRFRVVPMYRRWADPSLYIAGHPKRQLVKRWRTQQREGSSSDGDSEGSLPAAPQPANADGDLLTYVPDRYDSLAPGPSIRGRRAADPVRLVHALSVVRHLRSPKLFVEALDDTYDYLFQDEDVGPRGDRHLDPSRTSLQRALARSDVVSMNITRRMFMQWRLAGVVKAINVYCDASPVTGAELQGMIIDVVFNDDREMERITLPGSTLAYGFTGTMSKGVALLWAIWLVAGPSTDELRWFCTNVRSFTTDFGVEMHLLDLPDISEAMVAWASGRPLHTVGPLVKPDSRLFARALRIAGWSHTMGGVMKGIAEKIPQWPPSLTHMRALCKFYKNSSYRRHIRRKMDLEPEADRSLIHFTAGFAKWRYETVFEVQRQLLRVRVVSQLLQPQLFARPQDQELFIQVMAACRDAPFWRFTSVSFTKIFSELEYLRRWGMVCECPAHREQRRLSGGKKFIKCSRTHDYQFRVVRFREDILFF